MKSANLESLRQAFFHLKELETEAEVLIKAHNSAEPFKEKKVFHSQQEYDEYATYAKDYWKADDDRKQKLKMYQFDIELKEKEVLELIPLKAVWFNLPTTLIYLAKTSNNSMDRDGRNLHSKNFETAYEVGPNGVKKPLTESQLEGLLPKLGTL